MRNTRLKGKPFEVPTRMSYVEQGTGRPIICIHGIAASYHDWDVLLPLLADSGYHAYAIDLLGHGDSPKPDSRSYKTKWALKHLEAWIDSLRLPEPPILIGHSLGGYFSMRYAMRNPDRVRALVLSSPFYRIDQLPILLRRTYRRPTLNALVVERTPGWLFHWIVNLTNVALGRTGGSASALSESVRLQTAIDYKRTAPGAFNLPNTVRDLTPDLHHLHHRTFVIWGDRDQTLAPKYFPKLVEALPNARGHEMPGGHVPHQSNAAEFNRLVMEFLKSL